MRAKRLRFHAKRREARSSLAMRVNLRKWHETWAVPRGPWHGPDRNLNLWLKHLYSAPLTDLIPRWPVVALSLPL